jgi:hypothetical protein
LKNPADPPHRALQPKGAGRTPGSLGAKDAAQEINADRLQHFKTEPDEPSKDAERVTAQSLHARVSNVVGAAVNS